MTARCLVLCFCLAAAPLPAQESRTQRTLCDPTSPLVNCQATSCACSADETLEIIFDERGTSVLLLDEPSAGTPVHMTVFMDTKSPDIWGWSYGIAHDRNRILLESVSFDGTDAEKSFLSGFKITTMENIQTCPPMDARCERPEDGGGYISAVLLSIDQPAQLPLGRSSLSRASYIVRHDSFGAETPIVLTISDRLKRRGSPPMSINITNRGTSDRPATVADGWIVLAGKRSFRRGDSDGDGRLTVLDSISILLFLFLSGPTPECLEAADFQDDGRIDVTDAISIPRWLFLEGPSPADPGHVPECGRDPEDSAVSLGCYAYGNC